MRFVVPSVVGRRVCILVLARVHGCHVAKQQNQQGERALFFNVSRVQLYLFDDSHNNIDKTKSSRGKSLYELARLPEKVMSAMRSRLWRRDIKDAFRNQDVSKSTPSHKNHIDCTDPHMGVFI